MKARAYRMGRAIPIEAVSNPGSTILEVETDDGRTVQMAVSSEGHIHLRAWGNIPQKVGNGTAVTIDCIVPFQEPTTCITCGSLLTEGCGCDNI